EAEQHLRRGEPEQAREQFRQAAVLQRQFIESLPKERVRTRSVYGLSAATLYYRAHQWDVAARLAHLLLAQEWIEPYAASRLEELLARIRSERVQEEFAKRSPERPARAESRTDSTAQR